jgi:hypothetical protein
MQQRPQIDEYTRKQLLDNYLRNQQVQSSMSSPLTPTQPSTSFHPSMFQNPTLQSQSINHFSTHPQQPTISQYDTTSQIDMHSDISSRRSVQQNSIVPVMTSGTSQTLQTLQLNEQSDELPDNISIEDFTTLVQKWIEIDNWLKKSQDIMKEKRKQKDKLKKVITHYMSKYNIEDLNTSEGKIRCKVQYVKSGVNQKVVKNKIVEFMQNNEEQCNALITKIFNEREKVEKMSLRRIKIT